MKSFVMTFSVKNQTSNATTKNALTAKQSPWNLKCSSKCYVENVDCHVQDHVTNFKQFEQIKYFHAGKSKKKLSLNNNCVILKEFVQYFHKKIETFADHHFNLKHTDAMIDNLLESLRDHELLIVQDFSENYNCLLPDEPQTIH